MKQLWAWCRRFMAWLKDANQNDPVVMPQIEEIDWFVWESEQIQRNGYVFWFDHWRYDGQLGQYPDPTPAQRRIVFQRSLDRAIEKHGLERVEHSVAAAVKLMADQGFDEVAAFRRVRDMGQDPVAFAIDLASGKTSLH